MSIAISGTKGLLGSELKTILVQSGYNVLEANRPELDITNPEAMLKFFSTNKIEVFINCAAYTDVPKAEVLPEEANNVNNEAVGLLARLCAVYKTHLIHFSTDFVFDGSAGKPYKESDPVNPLNYYGYSKLSGENSLKTIMNASNQNNYTIFRVQWLYGHNEKNFFQKILSAAKQKKSLSLVDDEYGSPCSVNFISKTVLKIIDKHLEKVKGETYHLTHDTSCSRFTCGKYFLRTYSFHDVHPVNNLYMGDLKRPKYGVLDNSKLRAVLGESLGTWEDDLMEYIQQLDKLAEDLNEKN